MYVSSKHSSVHVIEQALFYGYYKICRKPKLISLCLMNRVPVISGIVHRKKRSDQLLTDDFFEIEPDKQINNTVFEPAVHVSPELYCNVVNNLPKACLLSSILDIWEYDTNVILHKTKKDIINDINTTKISPTLGHPLNFIELLGGITRDEEGKIISATAVRTQWAVNVNFSKVDMNNFGNDVGTADWVR